jgi:hypothetical protein
MNLNLIVLRSLLLLAREALLHPGDLSEAGRRLLIEEIEECAMQMGWKK